MAEARITSEEDKAYKSLTNEIKENRFFRRLFVKLFMDNLLKTDTDSELLETRIKVPGMQFDPNLLFCNNCRLDYGNLLLQKGLLRDDKQDYSTDSYSADMLYTCCLDAVRTLALAQSDPTHHGLIQKIRVWFSFVSTFPYLDLLPVKLSADVEPKDALQIEEHAKLTSKNLRKTILDQLVNLAKQSTATTEISSRPPTSISSERLDLISTINLARKLLRNIWDIDTLRMLMADKLSQDILTQAEVNKEASLSENKNATPLIERKVAAPNLFSQAALPREYIDIILFLNKKLKVFEKINEYTTKEEDRQSTLKTLKKAILTAKNDEEILQAFFTAVGDIKQRVRTTVRKGIFGTGSVLYEKMQQACNEILGQHIDLLNEFDKRQNSPGAGPGSRAGNAAADS